MNSDKVPRCDRTQIQAQRHLKLPGAADRLSQTLSRSPAWARQGDAQLEGFTGCSYANTGFSTWGCAEVLLSPRCCSSPSSLPSPTFSGTSLGSTSSQKNLINCFFAAVLHKTARSCQDCPRGSGLFVLQVSWIPRSNRSDHTVQSLHWLLLLRWGSCMGIWARESNL